jgi:predicted neuraminidase
MRTTLFVKAAGRAALALLLFLPVLARAAMHREFIYQTAPFPSAHASTLVELPDGRVMAAWFGGKAEGAPDVAIWSSIRSGGPHGVWSPPVEIARAEGVPCWNPVLFYAGDRLWLYYKFGPGPSSWTGARRFSLDNGHTWSAPKVLSAGILGPIRTKPLVLDHNTIVSGTSVESYHDWAAWIERSIDGGLTWRKIGPVENPAAAPPSSSQPFTDNAKIRGLIQPTVLSLGGGHLRLYARATQNIGYVSVSDSFDGGLTWSRARVLDVLNPNSGIDIVRLHDGRFVLIYNDSARERTPLALAVSTDGEHFRRFATLEDGPGEYSYPAIIQAADGDLEMTYTWQRKRIRYATLPLAGVPRR